MSNTVVAGKYTLRNKDIPLIKFDLLRKTVTVNGIIQVIDVRKNPFCSGITI